LVQFFKHQQYAKWDLVLADKVCCAKLDNEMSVRS